MVLDIVANFKKRERKDEQATKCSSQDTVDKDKKEGIASL
jgi:hypothetical protein